MENLEMKEKQVEPILMVGYTMKGRYDEVGKGFRKIGRYFGRYSSGEFFTLYHNEDDSEPNNIEYEVCCSLKKEKTKEGFSTRELEGGKCLSFMHKGSYEGLKDTYEKIMNYCKEKNIKYKLPTREIYRKGPGMIFKGNPKKYITEIQIFV